MKIKDILRVKGSAVHSISPDATLGDVVDKLVEHNCGSLVVCDEGPDKMVGIITERDILRQCAARTAPLDRLKVRDCMTAEVVVGDIDNTVNDTMGLMTDHRIRHLPIVQDGRLTGIISIGDVVKAQHDHLTAENQYLREYIQS